MKKTSMAQTPNYDELFEQTYDRYQQMISDGHFHGDTYDQVDTIMDIIWNMEAGGAGAGYDLMETDAEKKQYIEDYKNACDWLFHSQGQEIDADEVARSVIAERT